MEATLASIVAAASPLVYAVVGETIAEKAGVINLSLDGSIMLSAMAGFAAATYLRGIPWVALPTSLLAMVDASLGGGVDNGAIYSNFFDQGNSFAYCGYDPRLIAEAKYIIVWGANPMENQHRLARYLVRAQERGAKLVYLDPRFTKTAAKATEWIPIRPGTYGALALGIANVIINSQLYNADFVRDFTFGFEDFTDVEGVKHQGFKSMVLESYTLERVSSITGISIRSGWRIAVAMTTGWTRSGGMSSGWAGRSAPSTPSSPT